MALKDILAKLKGLMPDDSEEEEIAAKSRAFQAEEEAAGAKPMPEEEGIEVDSYLPGGMEDYINPKGLLTSKPAVAMAEKVLDYAKMAGPKVSSGLKMVKDRMAGPKMTVEDVGETEAYLFSKLSQLKDTDPRAYKEALRRLKDRKLAANLEE